MDTPVQLRIFRNISREELVTLMCAYCGKNGISVAGVVKFSDGSSNHTVLDITDCSRDLEVGDKISFSLMYMNLLYCFTTRHVEILYR